MRTWYQSALILSWLKISENQIKRIRSFYLHHALPAPFYRITVASTKIYLFLCNFHNGLRTQLTSKNSLRSHIEVSLRRRYTGRFATTIFNATHQSNIVATLFRMVATLCQHCNTVLRQKSSLRIVPCSIPFKLRIFSLYFLLLGRRIFNN